MKHRYLLLFCITFIAFGCKKTPEAIFEFEVLTCESPYMVSFNSYSINTQELEWNINGDYYSGNDVQVALNGGELHTVSLTASNGRKSNTLEREFYAEDHYIPPVASFEFYFPNCEDQKEVQFFNTSEGIVETYFWDFGDGETSTAQNPTHNFGSDGLKTVQLYAIRCSDSILISQNIPVFDSSVFPVANGKLSSNSGEVGTHEFLEGSTIRFEDQSDNGNTRLWRLWDGTTSTISTLSKTIYSEGYYTVELVSICGEKRDSTEITFEVREPETMSITGIQLTDHDEFDDGEYWDEDEGRPDIYFKLYESFSLLKTSSTDSDVRSYENPDWNLNEVIDDINASCRIEFWDRDSGSDDFMYEFSFNPDDFYSLGDYPSVVTLSSFNWKVRIEVEWK